MLNLYKTKLIILMALLCLMPCAIFAAGSDTGLIQKAHNDLNNQESLQRGAKYFVNYCLGCHSAKYVRYSRVAEDLDISEDELVKNLMFNAKKPFEVMLSSMQENDAERWFGAAPPDLSLIGRSRNADWLYTYLKSFYKDEKRPLGSNNLLLPGASMPNVFWDLQGEQVPIYHEVEVESENAKGEKVMQKQNVFSHLAKTTTGSMSDDEFDGMARDIVNFLDYIGEPVKIKRQKLGFWVILYLVILFLFTYFLKKEIWKDVH